MHLSGKRIDSQPEILSPLTDYIFTILFGDQRHIDILGAFLKTVLDLPEEDYDSLTIVNPILKRLFKNDKAGIVDVRLTARSGKVIHVELQVKKALHMRERLVFYAAKLLGEQIKRGENWEKLQQVVSIVICDHNLLPEERSYINAYELRNERTNGSFTDLVKLIILELPKLSEKDGSAVWPWLKLFMCNTRAQYEELARKYPEVGMAVSVLKEISLVGRIRMLAEAREIQRRDNKAVLEYERAEAREQGLKEGLTQGIVQGIIQGREQGIAQGIEQGREQGIAPGREQGHEQGLEQGIAQGSRQSRLDIARRMKIRGVSPDQIAEDTGLSTEDIAGL
jgi:predicted transposase/invertase (TIGR01784 family)